MKDGARMKDPGCLLHSSFLKPQKKRTDATENQSSRSPEAEREAEISLPIFPFCLPFRP